MARIVITGAGMNGLSTARLLAADGHDVTVLERDPQPIPSPDEAWDTWERTGVGQFRQLHLLLPRWRHVAEQELPDVVAALDDAGALRFDLIGQIPDAMTGPPRPEDADLHLITARRPVIEAAMAGAVESTPGVTVRRGVAVAGLLTGASVAAGVPHVVGVATEDGESIPADLVVDATGRRSPLRRWLDAVGCPPFDEQEEDLGFVYYGRHFRSPDGSFPEVRGTLLQPRNSYSLLTLPADRGAWGVGVIASSRDRDLRRLRDNAAWERLVAADPVVGHWIDGEPLEDVTVMAKLPDRIRRFVVDGAPVVTGLVAVGDSWACTNPSLGRGITIGLLHCVALRDLLRTGVLGDHAKLPLAWDDATQATVQPWYDATLGFDRHRLAQIDAEIAGESYDPGDPSFEMTQALGLAAAKDPDALRALQRIVGLLAFAPEALADPDLFTKVVELGGGWREAAAGLPPRSETLRLLTRAA